MSEAPPETRIDPNFQQYVHDFQQPGTKALIYCFAPWAEETVRLRASFAAIALPNRAGFACAEMDTYASSLWAEKYFVRTVPAVLVFEDSVLVHKIEGTGFGPRLEAFLAARPIAAA